MKIPIRIVATLLAVSVLPSCAALDERLEGLREIALPVDDVARVTTAVESSLRTADKDGDGQVQGLAELVGWVRALWEAYQDGR